MHLISVHVVEVPHILICYCNSILKLVVRLRYSPNRISTFINIKIKSDASYVISVQQ